MIKRKAMIVFFKNIRALSDIDERIVNVAYISEKRKYAVIYCDENKAKGLRNNLVHTKGIIDVIDSRVPLESIEKE